MQAIILAAGMGKRLKELTQDRTKCMVQVNGVALIDRMLHQIESRHLSRIVIVVGYEGEKLMEYIDTLGIRTPIVYVQNPIYDKTNNIYSLAWTTPCCLSRTCFSRTPSSTSCWTTPGRPWPWWTSTKAGWTAPA